MHMISGKFQKALCRRNGGSYTAVFEFEGKVQEVGCRLKAWVVALGHEDLQKGRLENIGKNRMHISLTSGSLRELRQAYGKLCNPKNIPANAKVTAVRQINANNTKTLPAERVTDMLMLEQQSKGVDYLKDVLGQLSGMNKKLDEKFDGLGSKIDGLGSNLGSKIDGLGSKIDNVGKKFDNLPDKISDKLSVKFDGLGSKIDALPEKIARAMKAV